MRTTPPASMEQERYNLLPSDELDSEPKEYKLNNYALSPRWTRLCTLASVVFVVLNHAISIMAPLASSIQPAFTSRAERLAYAATLPRPSMYIGLPRMNRTTAVAALPAELVYFPHVFAPVSSSEPNKVWPTDGRERRTFNGVVSPGEPHVIMERSSGTSMIMQLRVQDYGLERCAISATLPSTLDARLKHQNRTLLLGSKRMRLNVWQLEIPDNRELDLTTLNWHARPARSSLIASIIAEADKEVRTPEFDCGLAGSLRTYEIACADSVVPDDECRIEFWQEQPEIVPRMAFVMVQKPSL